MKPIIIGIDAVNLRNGGGITHLKEFLTYIEPKEHGINKIIVFSGHYTLNQLPERAWLIKYHEELMDGNLLMRTFFQLFKLTRLLKKFRCDILFAPSGTYQGKFHPFVGMSQNMLLFEKKERDRHGFSWAWIRLNLLRMLQLRSFRRAEGIIFISKYAKNYILNQNKSLNGKNTRLIHHGVGKRFRKLPKQQHPISYYSMSKPFRLLYISSIDCYKHQWILIEAVSHLRKMGYPVVLDMIGAPLFAKSVNRLELILTKVDPLKHFANYLGTVSFEQIEQAYHDADGFIYASTCENMPNIVIEAMSSGLPIMSSNYGPMPEFLEDSSLYFDPTLVEDTIIGLKEFLDNANYRAEIAAKSYLYAQKYTWETCTAETLKFLKEIVTKNTN